MSIFTSVELFTSIFVSYLVGNANISVIGLAMKRFLGPKLKRETVRYGPVRYGTVRCLQNLVVNLEERKALERILNHYRADVNLL
jgi:hypothetical protein